MKKLLIWISAIVSMSAEANAQQQVQPESMRRNVYYHLSPERAAALKINLEKLKRDLAVRNSEIVTVLLDENDQLNLSIFDHEVFSVMAMDIIK